MQTPAVTCGMAHIDDEDVHANQKRPMGNKMEPTIMGGRRASGMTNFPERSRSGLKRMRVSKAM